VASTLDSGLDHQLQQAALSQPPWTLSIGYCTNLHPRQLAADYSAAGLRVYVTENSSDVYEDTFRSIATFNSPDSTIQPTLILLGIRLGPDRITPVYHEALKASLTYP
jgi:hypothetical protein